MKTKSKKKYRFVIEKTHTGYSAYCKHEPIFTTGSTISELNFNILEATILHLEEEGLIITMENIRVELDLEQLFEYFKVINAKHLARKIGMNESLLNQYVKGKKKPSQNQLNRILEGIQQIGNELRDINLVGVS